VNRDRRPPPRRWAAGRVSRGPYGSGMTIETRVDPETGDWRLVAPARSTRPDDSAAGGAAPVCPFCPGNEHLTPPERMRVPDGAPDWRIRVVPNKYAVTSPADGDHEVVIESPRHDWDLRDADPEAATELLLAVRSRCRALGATRPLVVAFRNYGKAAGASLSHPHSQIVALTGVPPAVDAKWRRARDHRAATGRRLLADIAAQERSSGVRVVADTDGLLVFQPHAAAVPHHTVLLPADRCATLARAADSSVATVARRLPGVLAALAAVLHDPAYNLVVHVGPSDEVDADRWYQWHISVYPRVGTIGGLELATGLAVNTTAPEQTAPVLREALAASVGGSVPD